jgi:hypothetical protein
MDHNPNFEAKARAADPFSDLLITLTISETEPRFVVSIVMSTFLNYNVTKKK